jgi:hypothetical protein
LLTKLSFDIKHHIYHQSNHSLSQLTYLNNSCNKFLVYYHIINHNISNLEKIITIFIMTSQIQMDYNKRKRKENQNEEEDKNEKR